MLSERTSCLVDLVIKMLYCFGQLCNMNLYVNVISYTSENRAGIITRRPLVLQLHRIEEGREYAEFAHLPRTRFTDFGMNYRVILLLFNIFSVFYLLYKFICYFTQYKLQVLFSSQLTVLSCVAAVRKEIADETDRETGRTKQISSVPIYLSIYSPNGEI